MSTLFFPTWPVEGPPPLPPVHGLLPAAQAPAAGVRIVVDTTDGPADLNDIAPDDAGLEDGLYRQGDGTIWQRMADGSEYEVWTPANAGRERWLSGAAVWAYPADTPQVWNACLDGSGGVDKTFGDNQPEVPSFQPVTLQVPITCTTQAVMRGGKPAEDRFKARAVAVMAASESFGIAQTLIGGAGITGQPYLADGEGTFPNGNTATDPTNGLAILENQIALTGRLGLIHCTPMLATALLGSGFVIKDKTGVIRTINGNVVIPDAGYVGAASPIGRSAADGTEEWAYATGPVDIRHTEIFTMPDTLVQALDRGEAAGATNGRPNTVTYHAERYTLAVWDTVLQAAVLIDRCRVGC